MSDENEEYAGMIRDSIANSPDGTVSLPIEAIRFGLMPGEAALLQDLVHTLVLPQPGGYMVDALDVGPVTEAGLAAAYLLGADDGSLARPGAEFAGRLGQEPVMVPGGHMAMLSRPAEVAAAILGVR